MGRIANPRTVRPIWIVYALALFIATHWPGLAVPPTPISRLDLLIHACVLGIWTLLFYHSNWIGERRCAVRRVVWTAIIGIVYSAFDEFTQPIFNRVADPLDLAADITGVVLMSILILICGSMMTETPNARSEES